MKANLRAVGAVILGSVVLGACATKGFVRTSVRDERAARIAADSGLSNTITHRLRFQGQSLRFFLCGQFAWRDIQQDGGHTGVGQVRGNLRPHRSRP